MARTMPASYIRSMPFSRAWWALCMLACGGAPQLPTSQHRPWRELRSEHFTVWTDASQARARELVPAMENLRQVVLAVSSFTEGRGKVFVIAFDTADELHAYLPVQFIAHAWSAQNVLRQPVIVLAAESLEHSRWILTHELTHVITYDILKDQPAWFAEGIATYFETVRLDDKRARVTVGEPQTGRLRTLDDDGLLPVAQLFACTRPQCEDDAFYATAWALYTYLVNQHPHELARYSDALAALPPGDPPPTWTAVVPSLPPDKLDDELATWVESGPIRLREQGITLRSWPVAESPITDADVLAAKGVLRFFMAHDRVVLPEIDEALVLDPTNVLANLIQTASGRPFDPETAQRLAAAHPQDWRAWWLAWRAATSFDESSAARTRMCALVATSAIAWPIDECR